MKPTHLLAGLFCLAAILLDLVVLTRFESGYETPLMLFLGLAFGQLALLAYWSALGRQTWLPRLGATLAAAALLSRPLGTVTAGQANEWFLLFCLFLGCVATVIRLAVRRDDVSLTESPGVSDPPRPPRRWSQFSLGSLLSLMTAVGLALGLSRHVAFPAEHALTLASYGLWLILIALTSLWALLSRRAVSWRLFLLSLLCLVAGRFMAGTEHYQDVWFFTMLAFVEAIVICFGMAALQAGRMRFAPSA